MHSQRNSIIILLFIITLALLPLLFSKTPTKHIDYNRPVSDYFDSLQVEMLKEAEQPLEPQQDSLKQYKREL
ncbi:MAG: hypothetical protein ICV84_25935 [Flavisolibacter sp.]|nr:hypothetical protein [Flavisolibacter sp.]MBD0298601.1 hypothetical protein [Flavisolibacter sp.]